MIISSLEDFDNFRKIIEDSLPDFLQEIGISIFNEVKNNITTNGVPNKYYKVYLFYAPKNASAGKRIRKTNGSNKFQDGFKGYKQKQGVKLPSNNQVNLEYTGVMFQGMVLKLNGNTYDIEFTNIDSDNRFHGNIKRYGDFMNDVLNKDTEVYEVFISDAFQEWFNKILARLV